MGKILFMLFIVLSLALIGCGEENSKEAGTSEKDENVKENDADFDMDPVVWTMADYADASTEPYKQRGEMFDKIYERTGGLLDIQQHAVSEFPFDYDDLLSVTSNRTVEMSNPSLSYIEGEVKMASIVEWPMLVSNNEEMQTALDVIEPYVSKQFDEKGVE